jgi:GNAT superfamily N-acetyltransferase
VTESILPRPGEHLTNGWETDAPADDTLVRKAVTVHASWPIAVAEALGRPWRRTDRWSGALVGESGALTNPVILTSPVNEAESAELVAEIGELVPPETSYFLLSPWLAPDFARHGLALLGHPPLMVRLPAPKPGPDAQGVEVREARDADALAVAERVLVEGYPMPGTTPGSVLAAGLLGSSTRVWVGYVDDEPVSVAAAHQAAGATLVEYVAALPAARGRGAGAAVTWAATLADPEAPAVLVASDDGRPTYERMGYVAVERWTAWLRPGAAAAGPDVTAAGVAEAS